MTLTTLRANRKTRDRTSPPLTRNRLHRAPARLESPAARSPCRSTVLVAFIACTVSACSPAVGNSVPPMPADAPPAVEAVDSLAEVGLRASVGAVPGFVDDDGCAACHDEKARSYASSGMARAFRRSTAEEPLEDWGSGPFFHERSRTFFEMKQGTGGPVFRSWQEDGDGNRLLELELPVDYVLGSGHRARVYLYRAPGGELFQLPLAWYSEDRAWRMAPGFDRPDHDGVTRRIRRECLSCHNAYPEVPPEADTVWAPQSFPAALPEGIGCQRCHGPGGAHVRAALAGGSDDDVRRSIVNPARLERSLRDAVCEQCHLLPSVALPGPRRFDRGDYSFRPGEPLAAAHLSVDVEEEGRRREDRFEINHHAYRLMQSPCARDGRLHCASCHDPHHPLGSDPRLAAVRDVCLGCHPSHGAAHRSPGTGRENGDCTSCHMSRRRTQDVVHVTMTDHRISRRPALPDPLAPLEERDPVVGSVEFLRPAEAPPGPAGHAYLASAALRAGTGDAATIDRLRKALEQGASTSPGAPLDLAFALLQRRRMKEAEDVLESLSPDVRGGSPALGWLGLARAANGRADAAIPALRAATDASPGVPELWFNLGLVLRGTGRPEEALGPLTRATALRPTFAAALYQRGMALSALARREEAIADLERSLAIAPRDARASAALVRLLKESGRHGEASRLERHVAARERR